MENEKVYVENAAYDEGISLIEIFNIIWKRKVFIFLCTVIVGIFSFIGVRIYNNNNAQLVTVISLQWNGITEGEYPDGQLFHVSSMFETHVLNEALIDAGLDRVSTNKLRNSINVTGIVPNNIVKMIEQSLAKGQEMTYYPTDFKLTLNYGSLGINASQGEKLIEYIISNFREDFERTYIMQKVLVENIVKNLDEYDYPDMYDVLNSQLKLIENSINRTFPQSSKFVSSNNGLGFDDLLVIVNRIRNTKMQDMLAGLETSECIVSKNPELTIIRYENQIDALEIELTKQTAIKTELTKIISEYKGGEHVIIIPGMSEEYQYNTNPYLNTLYEKLVETEIKIAEDNATIDLLEKRIAKLSMDHDSEGEDFLDRVNFVEQKAEQILNELDTLIEDTNTVLEDYNNLKIKNSVRILATPQVETPQSTLLVSAIGLVLGLMISTFVVIIQHNLNEHKKHNQLK